ncbi:helix-turn-helix domain-containing protein [Rhodovulum sp. FJ3]|uniref:helix-turn-helix domain-containing protein n=1 Tax=Rhodovulum sp. FJ3 TaxID=3079053 RepID=UPI00397B7FA9
MGRRETFDTRPPFTAGDLAVRWQCSETQVREMCRSGMLEHFKIGKMYRILQSAVEEFELCQTSQSDGSGVGFASSGQTPKQESDGAISLKHARERRPKQKR